MGKKTVLILGVIVVLALGFFGGVATERYWKTSEIETTSSPPKIVQYGRPYFGPRQVRTPEIHEEDYFIKVYTHLRYWVVVKVVRDPYWRSIVKEDEYGAWAIDVLYIESDGTPKKFGSAGKLYYDNFYLTDANVVSYSSGSWNPANALLRIDVSELTPSTIEEIMNAFMEEFGEQE